MSGDVEMSGNPLKFIWFTTLYNARAYYPILAILFLDLGLTLDQYVMLNLVWAASIFLFEVPSGALADTMGRKTLLVSASLLMVAEMACLLFAPKDGGGLLLALCVANRLLSGLSEAAASGADEALAYDSLPEEGREAAWDAVLSKAMRFRSVGFVIAMILGGLMYDPAIVNRILPENFQLPVKLAHRLPVALVMLQAIACVVLTISMKEAKIEREGTFMKAIRSALSLTLATARWVFTNPATRVILLIGLGIDAVVRNFATITSGYYRLIALPEWSFGFIGAAVGVGGYFVPWLAARLNRRFSTLANLALVAMLAVIGLAGIVPGASWWCLLPAGLLMMTMGYLGFTMSRALHRLSESGQRATVLSVKGLAFNLGYGGFSLAFSMLLTKFPEDPAGGQLRGALLWQLPFFIGLMALLLAWGRWRLARAPPGEPV